MNLLLSTYSGFTALCALALITAACSGMLYKRHVADSQVSEAPPPGRFLRLALIGGLLLVTIRTGMQYMVWLRPDSFEEQELGLGAWRAMRSSELPVEFRLAHLLASLGVLLGHDYLGLRLPFLILGSSACLLFVLMAARRGMRLDSILPAAIVLACLPYFTIATSRADELCYAVSLATIYLCLLWSYVAPSERGWGMDVLFGFSTGLLLYEHASVKLMGLLGSLAVPLLLFRLPARSVLRHGLFFSIGLGMVTLPILADISARGGGSPFFDGLYRHVYVRNSLIDEKAWDQLVRAVRMALGTGPADSRLGPGESAPFPTWLGALWCAAFAFGIVKRSLFTRLLALHVIAAFSGGTLLTSNFEIMRFGPAFVSLCFLLCILGNDTLGWLAARLGSERGAKLGSSALAAMSLLCLSDLLHRHLQISRAPSFRENYLAKDYVGCSHIDRFAGPETKLVLVHALELRTFSCFTPGETDPRLVEGSWVFSARVRVTPARSSPAVESLQRGTMVVFWKPNGFDQADESGFEDLRAKAGAPERHESRDIDGRLSVLSFCYECG